MTTARTLLMCVLAAGLLGTAPLAAPAAAADSGRPAPAQFPWFRLAPVGTWYATFLIDGAPPGFNLPALLTFNQDWTFTAVDGGDFGALPDLPFNQTAQHGSWRYSGDRKFIAVGMIFSFKKDAGMEGQLDNILRTRLEIKFGQNTDEFTAVVRQEIWFCPDTFSCPDPLTAAPDVTIPAEEAGFSILGRRVEAK